METEAVPTRKDDLQERKAVVAGTTLWIWLRRVDELTGPSKSDDTKGSTNEEYHCTYDDPEHLTRLPTSLWMHQKEYKNSTYGHEGSAD